MEQSLIRDPVLAQRVGSAIIGVPLIVLLVIAGGPWYVAAVAAALAVATLEFQHMRRAWLDPVSLLTAALAGGIAIGAYGGRTEWLIWIAAALAITPLAALASPTDPADRTLDVLWALGGVTYVGVLGSFIALLRYIDFGARNWVLLALISTFAIDTGAYAAGRMFGRHALAPLISPNKTVEGFAGGCAAGFGAVLLCNHFFHLHVEPAQIVALAIALPPIATAGDLAESAIKRTMGVKDTSELIPGHGGVLDRLDSVLFTFTAVYLFTQWVVT